MIEPIRPSPPHKQWEPTKERISFKPVAIALICAVLIAAGSCFGAIAVGFSGAGLLLGNTLFFLFIAGSVTAIITLIWLAVVATINAFRGR